MNATDIVDRLLEMDDLDAPPAKDDLLFMARPTPCREPCSICGGFCSLIHRGSGRDSLIPGEHICQACDVDRFDRNLDQYGTGTNHVPPVAEAKYDQPDFSELEKPADYDSGELPPVDVDSPEMFMQAQVAKRAAVKKIEVQGRNWWRRGAGGNYFKAYIYVNDQLVHVTPEQGGGSEMYLTAARDWLHKNGYIDTDRRTPLWQLREKGIEFVYGAVDVRRERDL